MESYTVCTCRLCVCELMFLFLQVLILLGMCGMFGNQVSHELRYVSYLAGRSIRDYDNRLMTFSVRPFWRNVRPK